MFLFTIPLKSNGDFVIIKEEYILYKGNPFEHVFIFSKLIKVKF